MDFLDFRCYRIAMKNLYGVSVCRCREVYCKLGKSLLHPAEESKNSDNCDFVKVSDMGKALYSLEKHIF